jgi:hypothetical protein
LEELDSLNLYYPARMWLEEDNIAVVAEEGLGHGIHSVLGD